MLKKNNKVGRIEMQSQALHGVGLTHEPDAAFEEERLSLRRVQLKYYFTNSICYIFINKPTLCAC